MARLPSLALSSAALATAALLLAPDTSTAYTLTGANLPLTQRDFRVFNNFADPSANDDATQHPNFTGFAGAVVAIWKGVLEWGSTLHGDGQGDPTQPFDLGSGGSNFDATFQGLASGPGGIGDNVVSAASTMASVLVFTEGGAGGWRMKFNEDFVWDDDSAGNLAPGALDIQGVMTRQYGFLLGLGTTSVPGSVMFPAASGSGIGLRDLGPDDAAGLQAIYGVAAASKPRIEGLALSGSTLTITGQNFSAFSNDVWFTREGTGGDGEPVQVQGVASASGGTEIVVGVPAEAGPGDVLVKLEGAGNATLSNAWPFDNGELTCGHAVYGAGLPGANIAQLSAAGAPSIGSAVQFALGGMADSSSAVLVFSAGEALLPGVAGGTLLIDPTSILAGFALALTGGAGSTTVPMPQNGALAGLSVHAQAFGPDAAQSAGWALSNGLTTTLCP